MIAEFQISSLSDLLEYLPNATPAEYKSLAQNMELNASDFEKYITWNPNRYTRNCIVRTDLYELILLCWDKEQETSIHCHGGEECWVYVIEGELVELNYVLDSGMPKEQLQEKMSKGEVSYMNDDMGYHKLKNHVKGRSLSLHLYMNPIDTCTMWNAEEKRFAPVVLKYDTLDGNPV